MIDSMAESDWRPKGLERTLRQSCILDLESGSACFFLCWSPLSRAQIIRMESTTSWLCLDCAARFFLDLMASLVRVTARQEAR